MDAREKAIDEIFLATDCNHEEAEILLDSIMRAVAVKYGLVSQQTGEGWMELERTAPNGGS